MIKSFICSTLVLLLVTIGTAWAQGPPGPGQQSTIRITGVLSGACAADPSRACIIIIGEGFLFQSPLEVTLAEFGPLDIIDATDTRIEAVNPGIVKGGATSCSPYPRATVIINRSGILRSVL